MTRTLVSASALATLRAPAACSRQEAAQETQTAETPLPAAAVAPAAETLPPMSPTAETEIPTPTEGGPPSAAPDSR